MPRKPKRVGPEAPHRQAQSGAPWDAQPDARAEARRAERNARHWRSVLDAQNLGAEGGRVDFARVVGLAETADVRWALDWLGPLEGKRVLDLGGGLGAMALMLARRGAEVVVADLSAPRLAAARRALAPFPESRRIRFAACVAESLPFADGAFDAVATKSVLIHTRLPAAAAECARVLAPGGRAVFIEPQARNPFSNAYRRLAAPREWAAITTYFGPPQWRIVAGAFRARGFRARLRPFHLLGFLASAFQFAVPWPAGARAAEAVTGAVDRRLFRAGRAFRDRAWFGVLAVGPRPASRWRTPTAKPPD